MSYITLPRLLRNTQYFVCSKCPINVCQQVDWQNCRLHMHYPVGIYITLQNNNNNVTGEYNEWNSTLTTKTSLLATVKLLLLFKLKQFILSKSAPFQPYVSQEEIFYGKEGININ